MNKELKHAIEMAIHRFLGNARWWTLSDILMRLYGDGIEESINDIIKLIDGMIERGQIIKRTTTNPNTGGTFLEYHLPDTRE